MHIKHYRAPRDGHAKDSGSKAAKYLTQDLDANGDKRDEVCVLEGNPDLVGRVADSSGFKFKYTSGSINWAAEDFPTKEQRMAVLKDYKKAAFPGLNPEQYAFAAVLHRHEQSVHIHTFTARVDLYSGNSLNIAPPRHRRIFYAVRDKHNWANGWSRPDDPNRARLLQPGRAFKYRDSLRSLAHEHILDFIDEGMIENRADIIQALKDFGLVIEASEKDYITIKDNDSGIKTRMKGVIYDENWQYSDLQTEYREEETRGNPAEKRIDYQASERADGILQETITRRAEYNRRHYPRPLPVNASKLEKTKKFEDETCSDNSPRYDLELDDYLWWNLGSNAIFDEPDHFGDQAVERDQKRDQQLREEAFRIDGQRREDQAFKMWRTEEALRSDRHQSRDIWREQQLESRGGLLDGIDSIRKQVDKWFARSSRETRKTDWQIGFTESKISRAAESIVIGTENISKELIATQKRVGRFFGSVIQNIQRIRNKGRVISDQFSHDSGFSAL